MSNLSLYERLGGYDALVCFVDDLLPNLKKDPLLGRFWHNRGNDGIARERQLLIDYLAFKTGGPIYYAGRDMKLAHQGMHISEKDWSAFLEHAGKTIKVLGIGNTEAAEIVNFVLSIKNTIVESE